jgi:hypothetical protein
MKRLVGLFLLLLCMTVLSSCQGFLDDYSYQPLKGMDSSAY